MEWDDNWKDTRIPAIATRNNSTNNFILTAFDLFIPYNSDVLEIGGAIGEYGSYLIKKKDCHLTVIDNSSIGIQKTRENIKALNMEAEIIEGDVFMTKLEEHDVVYSLGFIEHFSPNQMPMTIKKHLNALKKDGILIIGVPNFRGINLIGNHEDHNLEIMDKKVLSKTMKQFNVKELYIGYGGNISLPIKGKKGAINLILNKIPTTNMRLSSYLIGVFRK